VITVNLGILFMLYIALIAYFSLMPFELHFHL